MPRLAVLALCLTCLAWVLPAERPDPPLALVGGRVIPFPGADPIEEATVLVRNGRVEAVGRSLALPFDARAVDVRGLTLVPALRDACRRLKLDFPENDPEQGRPLDTGRDVAVRMPEGGRRGLAPEREAWRALASDASDRGEDRKLGFGAVLVAPSGLLLAGRGAWMELTGRPPREALWQLDAGQFASLEWRSGADDHERSDYPATLMGVLAHLRQVLLDAEHYGLQRAREEQQPGSVRLLADPTLAALQGVLNGHTPLVVEARTEEDIRLALGLGERFRGVRVVILGGLEAFELSRELLDHGSGVIHDLDFGEEPETEAKREQDDAPGPWDPGLPPRLLSDRHARWTERVQGVAQLLEAGVPVAFGSLERATSELLEGARTAIEHGGLDRSQALAAFVQGPHRVFGDPVPEGLVRRGAVASLAAWEGDPLDEEARVRLLVLDGVLFDLRQDAPPEDDEDDGEGEQDADDEPDEEAGEGSDATLAAAWPVELDEDRVPSFRTGGSVLLRGATVMTASHGSLPDTDVLVMDGRIQRVGQGLQAPDGVTVVDVGGRFLIPGIIDSHSHAGLRGGINEWTRSITAEVTVEDEVNPDDVALWRALAGGVTSIRQLHGSANVIGGRHSVIKLRWGKSAPEMVFAGAPPGVKFALGENPKRSNWGTAGRFPASRMGVEASLRRAFSEARSYDQSWQRHQALLDAGGMPLPPRRDLRLEALSQVLDGSLPVHSHCYRADEILMLMSVAEAYGFTVRTFQHVLEGYKVGPEMAAHGGLGGSTFVDWWGYKFEAYDATPYCAALMHEAGVLMSVNSDSDEHLRRLYLEAAKTVKYGGLSEQDALRMVTLNPAIQLGVADRVGSIDEGKEADLALFSHHPFDTRTRCDMTFVDGELVFERREGVYDAWMAEVEARIAAGRERLAGEPQEEPDALESRTRDLAEDALEALDLPADATRGASTPVRPAPPLVALVGGRVHTMERDGSVWIEHDPGVVLLRDGLIEGVFAGTSVPAGFPQVDVSGLDVWPGLIDAGSHLGLIEVDSVKGTVDTREIGRDQPDLRASTAFHPDSEHVPVARAAGITSALIVPRGDRVNGQSAVMALEGWTAPEALVADRSFLHLSTPSTPRDTGNGRDDDEDEPEKSLAERLHESWKDLRSMFADAREHARFAAEARVRDLPGPALDPRLEALAPYALGRARVMFEAQSADQIADALAFAAEQGLRVTISGGREAWKVADQLALAQVAVVVGPVLSLPMRRWDPYDAPFRNAALLSRAGVELAFRSGSSASSRNLPYHAAMAVAFGLPSDRALEALTAGAARVLGIGDRVGTLSPGKRADLLVTDGSPLQVRTRVHRVYIGGREVSLSTRHTELYERYRGRLHDPGQASR